MPIQNNLLHGKNVRLTAINEEDLRVMARWYSDAHFLRLFDARPAIPLTSESLEKQIKELQDSDRSFAFAIRPIGSEDIIGYLEIDGILWSNRVGGFGIGTSSDLAWQVIASFDYSLSDNVGLKFGYRHVDLDYSRGSGNKEFGVDAAYSGPFTGITFKW